MIYTTFNITSIKRNRERIEESYNKNGEKSKFTIQLLLYYYNYLPMKNLL